MLSVGSDFGRYRIDGLLGRGGMGQVFAARDTHLGRSVALKVINEEYADQPDFVARFQREASVLSRLDSPHVIAIHDHGVIDGRPYISTQLVRGGDLGVLLRQRGPLPPVQAVQVVGQVAAALGDAHAAGVVHRDIKPSNVLVRDADAAELHTYLCDFGIAASEADKGLTRPGSVPGTWEYLAPECGQGAPATPSSDIYALGCLLWATLTGRAPYSGSDAGVLLAHQQAPVPQLPGSDPITVGLNRVLQTALAKDPARRHPSATAFRTDLLSAVTPATRSALPPRPEKSKRGRVIVASLGALALLVGGITALVVWQPWDDPSATAAKKPTAGPSPTTPSAPAGQKPDGPVAFDLDGNGFGDLVARSEDAGPLTYLSDGSALSQRDRKAPERASTTAWGDFDGDDALEAVSSVFRGGSTTIGFSVTDAQGRARAVNGVSVQVTDVLEERLAVGDFDGDKKDDVAYLWKSPQGTRLVVLPGGRDGLGSAEEWGTPKNADVSVSSIYAGDWDRDGRDDLLLGAPVTPFDPKDYADRYDGVIGYQLLRSDGSSFDLTLPRTREPLLDIGASVMDDFLNTGGRSAVTVEVRGGELQVRLFEYDGERFVTHGTPQTFPWTGSDLTDYTNENGLAVPRTTRADFDGDGDIDVAFAFAAQKDARQPIYVLANDDGEFTAPEPWGEQAACASSPCYAMIDDQAS